METGAEARRAETAALEAVAVRPAAGLGAVAIQAALEATELMAAAMVDKEAATVMAGVEVMRALVTLEVAPAAPVAVAARSHRDLKGTVMAETTVVMAAVEEVPEVEAATCLRTAPCRTWSGPHMGHPMV